MTHEHVDFVPVADPLLRRPRLGHTTDAPFVFILVNWSKVPALGYGMPYAIGNTLLTIFGMIIVLLMAH